jgi:hypothetical protein
MPEDRGPAEESVEWRRLNDYLWAGTCEDGPVGTIEHGRRYYAIDTLGSVIARCHDLPGAQAAFSRSAEGARPADEHPRAGFRGRHSARSHAA